MFLRIFSAFALSIFYQLSYFIINYRHLFFCLFYFPEGKYLLNDFWNPERKLTISCSGGRKCVWFPLICWKKECKISNIIQNILTFDSPWHIICNNESLLWSKNSQINKGWSFVIFMWNNLRWGFLLNEYFLSVLWVLKE